MLSSGLKLYFIITIISCCSSPSDRSKEIDGKKENKNKIDKNKNKPIKKLNISKITRPVLLKLTESLNVYLKRIDDEISAPYWSIANNLRTACMFYLPNWLG